MRKGPGAMLAELLQNFFKKANTTKYPFEKDPMSKGFRGELSFKPELCIGCKICMKDCPSSAITVNQIAEKTYEMNIDLSKCIYCGQCVDSCPKKALAITRAFELAQLDKARLKVTFKA